LTRKLPDSRVTALLLALSLASCAGAPSAAPVTSTDRQLLASITIVESAHTGIARRKTGFEFYVHAMPAGVAGPVLEGEEFRDGRLVDSFDGGSDSAAVIDTIEKVGLAPFDFEREVEEVTARLQKNAAAGNPESLVTGSRDGAEWEIVIVTASGRLDARAWNPGSSIDGLAEHSENLAKLKAVIDLLAQYYGRLKIGL
jgi:hypothetical protein